MRSTRSVTCAVMSAVLQGMCAFSLAAQQQAVGPVRDTQAQTAPAQGLSSALHREGAAVQDREPVARAAQQLDPDQQQRADSVRAQGPASRVAQSLKQDTLRQRPDSAAHPAVLPSSVGARPGQKDTLQDQGQQHATLPQQKQPPSRDQLQKPDSPVFKDKRTYAPPLLRQSDALYEIWQAFLVSRKANAGDPLAQHELGIRYMLGRGIEADTVKAAYWFQQASTHSMLTSRFNLAILLYHGWGVSWNPFESYKAFLSCAESGMNEAQYVIGLYYTENLVVPRDYTQALLWIRKAADGGYAPAKEALPELEKAAAQQTQEHTAAADSTAFPITAFATTDDTSGQQATQALVKSVLLGGDPELRKALGLSHMIDQDVGVDSLRLQGIIAAAQAGSPEALAVLGRNSEKGIGRKRDVVEACSYYIRALRMDWPRASQLLWTLLQQPGVVGEIKNQARQNEPEAQFVWVALLGLGYESVLMKEEALLTPAQAIHLLRKGADRGHASSMNELALCCYSGRWVPQDVPEARRLWERAQVLGSREAEIRLAVVAVQQPRDSLQLQTAVALLARAAEDGSILAEVALAYCFERGVGVHARLGEAVRLYRIAARRGSQDAYRALRRLHDDLRPKETRFVIGEP